MNDSQREIEQRLHERNATDSLIQDILALATGYIERMNLIDFMKKSPHATPGDILNKAALFKLTSQFSLSLEEYPPNFTLAKNLLAQGVDINFEGYDGENLLSDVIMGYPVHKAMNPCMVCDEFDDCDDNSCNKVKLTYDSRYLPDVIRFFIENGFDVSKDGGKFGASALHALCWSTYDKTMLDAAKVLLDASADPTYPVDDGEDVFASINWKLSGAIPVDEDLEMECLYTAYYDIVEAKAKGFDYYRIQWWDVAVGKRIDRIISCASSASEAVYDCNTGNHEYRNCFKDDIILDCEGIMLRVTHYCHAYVNPCNIPSEPLDLSQLFASLIGRRIADIHFSLTHVAKERMGRHGSILQIVLDDGHELVVKDNGDQFGEEYCARFEVTQPVANVTEGD